MILKNQVAIITGGSDGIGFGIGKRLAEEGVYVYLIARTKEKLEIAQKRINSDGYRAEIRCADITNLDSIKTVINDVYAKNNRLDIFVNNAGSYIPFTIDSPVEKIRAMIELDMLAPLMITHYLLQNFSKVIDNKLKILTVSSQAALKVFDGGGAYGTAKKGLTSGLFEFENQLRVEGIKNIMLYRLYPGTVATLGVLDLVRKGILQNPTSLEYVVDTALDLLLERTPTRDAYIGFIPGIGIKRMYFSSEIKDFSLLKKVSEDIIDKNFDPDFLLNSL